MDKSAIRNFAIEARKILMKSAETEAGFYGISKDGCKLPVQKGNDFEIYETLAGTQNRIFGDDIKRRANLVQAIEKQGFEQVIEETAYTWFNRIIAIRFMEVNNYLPSRVRVLSSETGSNTPDIVSEADTVELSLTGEELQKILEAKNDNRYDDAFRLLFIKQCNELNEMLPGLFEKTNDYMELLLKLSYTSDGVIRMLVDTVPEDNFNIEAEGQVEIIGWMYQYYNTELKADTYTQIKNKIRITKEGIPAATQLFTPDWIVRYMVQNSLGRIWIEHLVAVDSSVDEQYIAEKFDWNYYVSEARQDEEVLKKLVDIRKDYKDLEPKDIKCIDPCMGSGHILVYIFDVFMDIYRAEGYNERDAVFYILENNICGLDIDRRAYQLSYFALMMKARSYNKLFFRGKSNENGERTYIEPKVFFIDQSNEINKRHLEYFGAGLSEVEKINGREQLNKLLYEMNDAEEYGSLVDVTEHDWVFLLSYVNSIDITGQLSLETVGIDDTQRRLKKLILQAQTMAEKYHVVVTNPPYMGNMTVKLTEYVQKKFQIFKYDAYAAFINKCYLMRRGDGLASLVTGDSWMTLSSFEKMRRYILTNTSTVNLIELGSNAFDAGFGTVAFVLGTNIANYNSVFIDLQESLADIRHGNKKISECEHFVHQSSDFLDSPGSEIAFKASSRLLEILAENKRDMELLPKAGIVAGSNDSYLRLWYELQYCDICFDAKDKNDLVKIKWVPLHKGGCYRKYYGLHEYVILLNKMLSDKANNKSIRTGDPDFYFKEGLTWSTTANEFGVRKSPAGFVYNTKGSMCFANSEEELYYAIGFLNSIVARHILFHTTGLDYNSGNVSCLPILKIDEKIERVVQLVQDNIEISKYDWNSNEVSWDFQEHPLVKISKDLRSANGHGNDILIKTVFDKWSTKCDELFVRMKANEEELNRAFIEIYGLVELSPEIEDDDIIINKADYQRDIRSLISYAVGCAFGRYSLDKSGLVFAGGNFNDYFSCYTSMIPVVDGIIPILDADYLGVDIIRILEEFLKKTFGESTIEQNMKYVSDALNSKGMTSREKIRNYFLKDFYREHCNMYSSSGRNKRKAPIYWLFDSGKENGFKCLVYLHRYTKDTIGIIRTDYLVKTQNAIENALKNAEYVIQTSSSATDMAQATKQRDKCIKQLAEIKSYYQALSHVAQQRIELDLDNGVKTNYAKFQGIEVSIEGEKKQTIDLLAKI